MNAKQKRQTAAGLALLAILLLWKLSNAKASPKAKVTIGPITVEDKERDQYDDGRERRALLRNKALDLIAFDEDAWQPTRRPSIADELVLTSIFSELAKIRSQIPDPEGYDAGFDSDLLELVLGARALDPSTTSSAAKAFGSSRYMTRRLNIEEQIRDLVAMDKDRQIRRRPTDGEMAVIHSLIAEHGRLGDKLVELDPEVESELAADEPLEEIVRIARALPASTSAVAAVSTFVPGSMSATV
jgi:hypothetical protein